MALSSKPVSFEKEKVSLKGAFSRFVFLTGLCLVLGLITRYFIESYPLRKVLLEKLQWEGSYELEIQNPHFQFRKGLTPVLAFGLDKLELKKRECSMESWIARDLLVVLSPLSFLFGEFRPKKIYVGALQIVQARSCFFPKTLTPPETENQGGAGHKEEELSVSEVLDFHEKWNSNTKALKNFWEKTEDRELGDLFSRILKNRIFDVLKLKKSLSVEFQEMEYKWIQDLNNQIVFRSGFSIQFNPSRKPRTLKYLKESSDSKSLSSALKFRENLQILVDLNQLEIKNKKIFVKSDIELLLGESGFQMTMDMALREGQVKMDGLLDARGSPKISLNFQVKQLPISTMDDFIKPSLSYLWLNCRGQLSSFWKDLDKKRIDFDECGLKGPHGNLIFYDIYANLFSIKQTKIKVDRLDLDKVLKDKKSFQLSGVFDSYGVLSAQGRSSQGDSGGHFQFDGFLENSQIVFSKNQFRELQRIAKTSFQIKRDKRKWLARVTDINIDKGNFDGEIRFEIDLEAGWVSGILEIPILQLSPAIYRLMLSADPAPLEFSGNFFWSNGFVEDWRFDLSTPHLKSKDYELKNPKVQCEGIGKDASTALVKISVDEGFFSQNSSWGRWLDVSTLGRVWTTEPVNFSKFFLSLKIFKDKSCEWENWRFKLKNSGWSFSSEGSKNPEKRMRADIRWFQPNKPALSWVYEGRLFEGQWSTKKSWIIKWLRGNRDFFKKHPDLKKLDENN